MSHARLSPSAADTWCNCPGSVRLLEQVEESPTSIYAMEGTAAHDLLERCLKEGNSPADYEGLVITVREGDRVETFTVDEEMIENATVATDEVINRLTREPTLELIAERKVDPGFLMNRRNDCKGTADISLVGETRLVVLDLKYGKGKLVEANGNLQTLLYAIGALAALPPDKRKLIQEIETGIIQPRIAHPDGPVRTVVYPVEVIYQWLMWFTAKAQATDDPNAPLVADEKVQCLWCDAKGVCPAMRDKALECFNVPTVPAMETAVLRSPETLTIEEVNLIDSMGDIVKAFIEAVRGYKLAEMKKGVVFPGSKLVRGNPGNRKFIEPDEEKTVRYVCTSFGLKKDDITAPRKLLTPSKILAMAKKSPKATDVKLKKLEARVMRPEGKVTIAPESDPRPAIGASAVEEAFKNVPVPTGESL